MRTSARQTRENRTITVDFQHEATYFQLLGDGKAFVELVIAFVMSLGFGSVTKRVLSRTASKAHGSSSGHGMAYECAHRPYLLEDSATSLLLVFYTRRCSGQGCPETFLLRFRIHLAPHPQVFRHPPPLGHRKMTPRR